MLISGRVFWSLAAIDHDGADELVSLTKREKKNLWILMKRKTKNKNKRTKPQARTMYVASRGKDFKICLVTDNIVHLSENDNI